MGFLKSLGETPHLYDVMNISPRMAVYLFKMTDEIMLVEGPLNDKERELIAAYVSGLNACSFCYRGHKAIAEMFGVEEGLIDELVEDLESVKIDDKIIIFMPCFSLILISLLLWADPISTKLFFLEKER